MLAPLKSFVRLVSLLPVALRPGVCLAAAFAVLYIVLVRPKLTGLYHASCRGAARVGEVLIELAVLPEYAITATRRKRGLAPGTTALAVGHFASPILSGTQALFERHSRDRLTTRTLPWKSVTLLIAICAAAWLVMDDVTPTSPTRHALTVAFQYWRDVESWADVSPQRRAASGGWYPPPPVISSRRPRRKGLRVELACQGSQTCVGRVVLVADGEKLAARNVKLKPHADASITLRTHRRRWRGHLRVRVVHR